MTEAAAKAEGDRPEPGQGEADFCQGRLPERARIDAVALKLLIRAAVSLNTADY
jgi:hypothetical protein